MAMEKAEAVTARTAFTPTKKNESVTDLVREHERQIEEQAENQPHGGAVSASWTEGSGNNETITTREQTYQNKNRCQIEKPLDLLHTQKENDRNKLFHWSFDNDYNRITEVTALPPSFLIGMKNSFLAHFYSSHYENEIGKCQAASTL
jgi:hypothetical protein